MPELDIRFDGTHFHIAVPESLRKDAAVRYELGPVTFETLLDSLMHYWIEQGGDLETMGTAKW
jgi:hypothetical protein